MGQVVGASMIDSHNIDPAMYQILKSREHPLFGWTYAKAFAPKH